MANLQMMRISLVLRALLMAVALVGWMAAPALAAPAVLSTTPEDGAEMHDPPGEVTIEFSEPLQGSSGIEVIDDCGQKVNEGQGRVTGTASNELNAVIDKAPHKGTYTVEYVATGVTGTTTGSFTFYVHGGTDCDGSGGGHHGGGSTGGSGGGGHNGGGHGGSGGGGGKHGGHGSNGGTDDGMDHTDGSHSVGSSGNATHDMRGHDMNKAKGSKHRNNKHRNDNGGGRETDDGIADIAIDGDPLNATDIPTGQTVAIALGLAVLLGLAGGWVLRVSSPR